MYEVKAQSAVVDVAALGDSVHGGFASAAGAGWVTALEATPPLGLPADAGLLDIFAAAGSLAHAEDHDRMGRPTGPGSRNAREPQGISLTHQAPPGHGEASAEIVHLLIPPYENL